MHILDIYQNAAVCITFLTSLYIYIYICSGNKFATPIDEKALKPLWAKGTYNHDNGTISLIWCAYFSLLLFTYPGCLWSGSSGSPSGSDSLGYLSPDHPHPRSATLFSPRIISQILYRDSSTQAASWHRRHL